MKRLISWVLTLVMILGMVPAVAFLAVESSAEESTAYTYVQQKPTTIASSDTGTVGAWYNNGSTFVTTEGAANYFEIVEDGCKDAGAFHVYQDNVTNSDMSMGVFIGGQAAGTYTLKLQVKGDLGLSGQTCKFYPYGCFDLVANLHDALGNADVADWTEVTIENIEVASSFYYLIFSFSKYNWATDMYVDNIQLINSSGVDVLNGAGNFCTLEEVAADSTDTNQWPDASKLDTATVANAYGGSLSGVWTPMYPTGGPDSGTWPAWDDVHYAEITANGYKDAGSLHLVSCAGKNTGIAINAGMTAGETYTLGFYAKGTVNTGKVLGMYANGDGTIISDTASFGAGWNYYEHTFTAEMSQINLVAADWGSVDIYVDNITLVDSNGTDLLAGSGDFYYYEEKFEICDSDPGESYKWYNGNGYTASDAMYISLVEEGADDEGALHIYQADGVAAAEDMRLHIRTGTIPVGTYTLQYNIKGSDLGITTLNDACRFYLDKDSGLTTQFRNLAGAKTVSDWTTLSETITTTTESSYIVLGISKYVCGIDCYVDNVKLLDANGNDLLHGAGNFCIYEPVTIAESNPGTNYEWFNHNGFVNNDTKIMEIVSEGANDAGSVHVYQPDGQTADADMVIGIRVDCVPTGTYTIQYNIKGTDLGNTDNNSNKFYLYGNDTLTNQFRVAAGAKTLSDWTTVTESFTTTSDVYYIYLMVSKYVNGADYYVDNVKLLDADGKDYLNGAGNFCVAPGAETPEPEPTEPEPTETDPPETEPTEPVVEGLATISSELERAFRWYWNGMTYEATDHSTVDISGQGANDSGSLHIWQSSAAPSDTNLCLATTMASDLESGSYTLSMNVKGTFYNTEGFYVYPAYCTDSQLAELSVNKKLAAADGVSFVDGAYVTDGWINLTWELPTSADGEGNGFMFLALSFSKYNVGEYYIDNIQVLDPNGNDVLGGAGSFMDSGSEAWPIILPSTGAEILNSNTMYYQIYTGKSNVSVSNHVEMGVTAGDQNFSVTHNGVTQSASNKNVTMQMAPAAEGEPIVFAITSNAGSIDIPSSDFELMQRADEFNFYDIAITALGCDHSYESVVTAPTLSAQGYTTHTCTLCGESYVDSYTDALTDVEGWSLTVGGDLSVNFKIAIAEEIQDTAQIVLNVAGESITYNAAEVGVNPDDNCFYVSANVAAAQMGAAITVQVVNGEDASAVKSYSVLQYAQYVLADSSMSSYHQLLKDMLNYGAMAQVYFDYDADNLVNAGIEGVGTAEIPADAAAEMEILDEDANINFYGATLLFRDKIAIRYYFTVSGNAEDYTFTVNGTECEAVQKGEYYYVEIADINPQDLDNTLWASAGGVTVSYCPMNYIVRMSQKGTENLQNLMKALYNYHVAAEVLRPDAV